MTQQHIGDALAFSTAICWTVSSLAFENASKRIGSLPCNLIRLVIAFIMLAIYGMVVRGQWIALDAGKERWMWLLASGVVGFFIGDLALFRAFVLIGSRLSTLIMSFAPPVAALLSFIFLKERISAIGIVGMMVTLAGIMWVVSERPAQSAEAVQISKWGLLLAFIGAVGQAGGAVLSRRALDGIDAFAANQIRAIAGIALFATLIGSTGHVSRTVKALRDGRAWGFMLLGAFAGPFLGVSLFLTSQQYGVPVGVAQTFAALVPILIIPFVIIIKKERVSPRAGIGAIIAVAGVAMLVLG